MSRVPVIALFGVLACNGDKGQDKDDGPTDTDVQPVSFDFVTSLAAKSYVANLTDETLAAHQISTMLLASTAIVVADEKVQDRLNIDGAGGLGARAYLDCWARPQFPMFSFSIDYTGCAGYQMGGGVFVDDHPSGPLLFEFGNFFIQERSIGGVFALDTRDAFPDSLYWQTYNTDGDNPGVDNDVQLGIKLDRTNYGVSYSGGASVNFLAQEWSQWGVATITVGETPVTVVHGASDAADVAPDDPPGAGTLKSSLNWLACRCPTSGISAYDMPLQFTEVTLDIDDLEDVPDEIDDPDITLPLDFALDGTGVLTHTGCGTYDVAYETASAVIPLPIDRLIGALSFQCDTQLIEGNRCNALVAAATRMTSDLMIEVSVDDATQTAFAAVDSDFDTTWCRLY